jgi:hypothetical protein
MKENEMGAAYNTQGQRKGAWKVLVRKPERRKLSWLYDMKIYVQQIICGVAWFDVAQDRNMWCALVDAVLQISVS